MRTAFIVIMWLTIFACIIRWECNKAGITCGDFCRGFSAGFWKGPEDYGNSGWLLGNTVAGVAWLMIPIIGIVVFIYSFIWDGSL